MVNRKNILIIETDEDMARKQAGALKEYGYHVWTANTEEMAMEIIREQPDVDLILMDIDSLPDLSIFSITGHIREGEFIPVICSSSSTGNEIIAKIESVSPYGFVEKKAGAVALAVSANTAIRLSRSLVKIRSQKDELAEAEIKYRSIVNNIEGIIYTINSEGEVIFVSESWKKQLGHDAEEVIGRDYSPFVHPEDVHICETYLRKTVESGIKQPEIEYRAFHKDGSIRWHRTNIIPVYDGQGNLAYFVGSTVDFTEKKKIEEELREANAAKDKFFSIIAHDLRGPMASLVRVFESVCRGEMAFDDELLSAAADSSRNIWNLLEDLLTWSRSRKGLVEFHPENIAVNAVLKQSMDFHRMEASRKNILLEDEPCDNSLNIFADVIMARTIISNLINNAIKFTPENGKVTLSAKLKDNYVDISVMDNGTGISPARAATLFNIDHRHYSTPGTNNEKGTGLGLIICREFVTTNKGTIAVQSAKNSGTTFTVSLPRGVPAAVTAEEMETLMEQLKCLKFLVIESNVLHIKTTGMVLDGLSLNWEVADDGDMALEMFAAQSHEIILMDIDIPVINSMKLAEKIRMKAVKPLKIIAFTSYPGEDFPRDEKIFDGYLHKPLDREYFIEIIKKFK